MALQDSDTTTNIIMSLPDLLATLQESVASAVTSLPDATTLRPPTDGISLLDTKNELLLSYLQNLVFLIILKLRHQDKSVTIQSSDAASDEDVVRNLVALRVYLEKGVRPLESRLKYQLDKLLLAAEDEISKTEINGVAANGVQRANGIATREPDESEEERPSAAPKISDLSYRPNPSAFRLPAQRSPSPSRKSDIYRPPQVTPVAPPSMKKAQRPRTSRTLDRFVREELDDSPMAEPSIGAGSGLKWKAAEKEAERRGYEEGRLVRLPSEGKKANKRRRDIGEGFGEDDFGIGMELGDMVKGGKKRRKAGGSEVRIGEAWEKRKSRGLGKRKRR